MVAMALDTKDMVTAMDTTVTATVDTLVTVPATDRPSDPTTSGEYEYTTINRYPQALLKHQVGQLTLL